MAILPFIFIRYDAKVNTTLLNHEKIHLVQQAELLCIGLALTFLMLIFGLGLFSLFGLALFFLWYGIEYIIRLMCYRDFKEAYRNISFEQEAYVMQSDMMYIEHHRKAFAFTEYLFKKTYSNIKK